MLIRILLNSLFMASLLTFSHSLLKWVAIRNTAGYTQTLIEYWWIIGIAIGIYGFIFFYYAYVLRSIAISTLYPAYTGLSIVFVLFTGAWLFGETMSIWQIFGCLMIIFGIFLTSGITS